MDNTHNTDITKMDLFVCTTIKDETFIGYTDYIYENDNHATFFIFRNVRYVNARYLESLRCRLGVHTYDKIYSEGPDEYESKTMFINRKALEKIITPLPNITDIVLLSDTVRAKYERCFDILDKNDAEESKNS